MRRRAAILAAAGATAQKSRESCALVCHRAAAGGTPALHFIWTTCPRDAPDGKAPFRRSKAGQISPRQAGQKQQTQEPDMTPSSNAGTGTSKAGYNVFLLIVAGLGGLLYGVDVGIIAGALPYLKATSGLNESQSSFIVAA